MSYDIENLYSKIPPTKLRNKDEKFKPSKTNKFWLWLGNQFFYGMLENRFFGLRYKNEQNAIENIDKSVPTILFAPHSNWWDGIVGYNIIRRILKKEIRIMVEELNRFPLLRRAGAFSVNKKSAQASMKALEYAYKVIEDRNNVLYIFPEGIIKPPNYRPIEFQTGIAYIAEKAAKLYGKVNLVPVAVNYYLLRADRPEVLVEFGTPIVLTDDTKIKRHEYAEFLAKALENVCDAQNNNVFKGELHGYKTLFQQKLKWYRKIEQRLKKIEIKGSGV
ncbi:lysophospholipid acyltransferase family protein [bacterium]|nr:lysophospholipid acyltransferase family protein [bacterium]